MKMISVRVFDPPRDDSIYEVPKEFSHSVTEVRQHGHRVAIHLNGEWYCLTNPDYVQYFDAAPVIH